jgi:hypothetical protein
LNNQIVFGGYDYDFIRKYKGMRDLSDTEINARIVWIPLLDKNSWSMQLQGVSMEFKGNKVKLNHFSPQLAIMNSITNQILIPKKFYLMIIKFIRKKRQAEFRDYIYQDFLVNQ